MVKDSFLGFDEVSTRACRWISLAYIKLPRANCLTLLRQWIRCAFNFRLLRAVRSSAARNIVDRSNSRIVHAEEPVEQLWQAWGQPEICRLPRGHVKLGPGLAPGLMGRVIRWSPHGCRYPPFERVKLYTTPKVPPREGTRPTTSCRPGPLTRRRGFMSSCIKLYLNNEARASDALLKAQFRTS